MKTDLVPLRLECGLIVWHTRDQWERFMRGVDAEAARAHDAELEDTDTEDTS